MDEMVSGFDPVFVRVTGWLALADPAACLPKLRLPGEMLAEVPTPFRTKNGLAAKAAQDAPLGKF